MLEASSLEARAAGGGHERAHRLRLQAHDSAGENTLTMMADFDSAIEEIRGGQGGASREWTLV
jgi:hypothetical protein